MTVALISCALIVLAAWATRHAARRRRHQIQAGLYSPRLFHWDDPERGRVCKPAHLMHGPAIDRLIRERNGAYDD